MTEQEIDTYLGKHLQALAASEGISGEELRSKIQKWYGGFCFSRKYQPVYNPSSLFLLLNRQAVQNYWRETVTPSFLIKLIKARCYDVRDIEDMRVSEFAFHGYEIERPNILPLLAQTGYLTIKDYDPRSRLYRLYYPNYEVEDAFLKYLEGKNEQLH